MFGQSSAFTGIPEGDPLSVVGMFVFAKEFDHYVQSGPASVLGVTYADNWELVARSAKELRRAIPMFERFLDLCHLIVAPSRCWSWATNMLGRRRLRTAYLLGQKVPVKLQAKELGADISYCHRKAAKVRNVHRGSVACPSCMVCRIPWLGRRGFSFRDSCRIALHAAESSSAPKTFMQRL